MPGTWPNALLLVVAAILLATPRLATAGFDPKKGPPKRGAQEYSGFLLRPTRAAGARSSSVSVLSASDKSSLSALGVNAAGLKAVGSQGWYVAKPGSAMTKQLGAKLAATKAKDLKNIIADFKKKGFDAEPNYVVRTLTTPNDDSWDSIQGAMERISAPDAWDITQGSPSVKVCIVDTGIQGSHPDLSGNVVAVYNALTGSTDKNSDDAGHGTHCAGTIGAVGNNGAGVAGVSWRVSLLSCKFLDSTGHGDAGDAITCIRWCRDQGAQIQSHSWGGNGRVTALEDEIRRTQDAGHLVIAAAGNEDTDIDSTPVFPGGIDLPGLISVGATDNNDDRAGFSNYGSRLVALFAPGVRITSTIPGSRYGVMSGTSMATPHVAGAVAVLWGYKPSASAEEIKAALLSGVDVVSGASESQTGGRLNLLKSLQLLGGSDPGPDPGPGPGPGPGPDPTPGLLDEAGCGALQEKYGLVPQSDWGSTPGDQQRQWTDSQCEPEKICRYWQKRHQLQPYVSWGNMPDYLKDSWHALDCDSLFQPPSPEGLDEAGCGALQEKYGLVPQSNWGSTPADQQRQWTDSQCEPEKICRYWQKRHQLQPYVSWGNMPDYLKDSWHALDCDSLFQPPSPEGLDEAGCGALQEKYGLVPQSDWGSTPGDQQRQWTDSQCEPEKICRYWQKRHQLQPYVSWGNMPDYLKDSWHALDCDSLFSNPNGRRRLARGVVEVVEKH